VEGGIVTSCGVRVGGYGDMGIEQRVLNAECGMVRQRTDDRR
jgi:hypothetical protein